MVGNFWERRLLNQPWLLCLFYQRGDSDIVWTRYWLFPHRGCVMISQRVPQGWGFAMRVQEQGLCSHLKHVPSQTQLRTWVLPALLVSTGLCISSQISPWTSQLSLWSAPHNYHTFFFGSLGEAGAHSWTQRYLTVLLCTVHCSTRTKVQRVVCTYKAATSLTPDWWLLAPDLASLLLHLLQGLQLGLGFHGKRDPSLLRFSSLNTQIIP